MANELELDHQFWNALSTNALFREWLIGRTKFANRDVDLVTDEKWHQRWYRDPETKRDSETDILIFLHDRKTGDRYAIHVENKPDHRKWERLQAENYRKRAFDRMIAWRYVDFQTALIAPDSFLRRCQTEAAHFDVVISYEDLGAFIPAFEEASRGSGRLS